MSDAILSKFQSNLTENHQISNIRTYRHKSVSLCVSMRRKGKNERSIAHPHPVEFMRMNSAYFIIIAAWSKVCRNYWQAENLIWSEHKGKKNPSRPMPEASPLSELTRYLIMEFIVKIMLFCNPELSIYFSDIHSHNLRSNDKSCSLCKKDRESKQLLWNTFLI